MIMLNGTLKPRTQNKGNNNLHCICDLCSRLQSTPLDFLETGTGLKFQAERPHLVSLGSGRLSTAITLLPLPEGETPL